MSNNHNSQFSNFCSQWNLIIIVIIDIIADIMGSRYLLYKKKNTNSIRELQL